MTNSPPPLFPRQKWGEKGGGDEKGKKEGRKGQWPTERVYETDGQTHAPPSPVLAAINPGGGGGGRGPFCAAIKEREGG